MTTLLRSMLIHPDDAASLTVARLDITRFDIDLTTDDSADAHAPDPQLEELIRTTMAKAEAEGHTRGFDAGYSEGMELVTREVTERLERETAELREVQRQRHEDEHALAMAENHALQERMQQALATVESAIASLEAAVIPRYEEVGRDLTEVVLTLVEDLLGHELQTDRAHVMAAITRALAEIPARSEVTVALHPADIDLLAQFEIDLDTSLVRPVTVVPDETVDRHGAIVRSDATEVDAQVRSSLERLREALTS